jgi:RimJ/RimL family protein N-acetyltransferase
MYTVFYMKILETDRLILRTWKPTDVDSMTAINQDPKVCEFLPAIGTRATTQAGIDRMIQHYVEHGFGIYAVELKENGELIGWVGLSIPSFEAHFTPAVEIEWRLASGRWGKGYAIEAAQAVLRYGFLVLNLPEIVSFTVVNNRASRRVMEKIGLYRDPRDDFDHPQLLEDSPLKKHVLYRLSKADYLASAPCIEWAFTMFQRRGYVIQSAQPEAILNTPWSRVHRFSTDRGAYYLKQTPPALSLEADVIQMLQMTGAAPVPIVVANNPKEHCFLMKDAGISLREYFKRGFDVDILIRAIHDYIAMQRKTLDYLPLFLDIRMPDWQLRNIPQRYQELIQQQELLSADGITSAELNQLSQLTPRLVSLCEQLAAYGIPDTVSHGDFHDNNILIHPQTQKITIIDLGEVEMTHPFFSLHNLLVCVKENYALTEDQYQLLQQRAVQPWLDLTSSENLLKIMSLIHQCWAVHAALVEYRLLTSVDSAKLPKLLGQGRLAKKLRHWLEQ